MVPPLVGLRRSWGCFDLMAASPRGLLRWLARWPTRVCKPHAARVLPGHRRLGDGRRRPGRLRVQLRHTPAACQRSSPTGGGGASITHLGTDLVHHRPHRAHRSDRVVRPRPQQLVARDRADGRHVRGVEPGGARAARVPDKVDVLRGRRRPYGRIARRSASPGGLLRWLAGRFSWPAAFGVLVGRLLAAQILEALRQRRPQSVHQPLSRGSGQQRRQSRRRRIRAVAVAVAGDFVVNRNFDDADRRLDQRVEQRRPRWLIDRLP